MKRITAIAAALAFTIAAGAQDFSGILSQIEENNTTLRALRGEADAVRSEALTGLTPEDPTVSFGYLWETSASSGNRINLDVTQTFDFPTVYYWKKKVADGECSAADLKYAIERKAILMEAEQACIDFVYHKALEEVYGRCLENARTVVDAWQRKYDSGLATAVDLNNAKLALLSADKECSENRLELEQARLELSRLNGGNPVEPAEDEFAVTLLPRDFETWFSEASSSSSELRSLDNEKQVAESARQLAVHSWMPRITVGYSSEKLDESYLQGVTAGISIPLWSNIGKVKAAKARQTAVAARADDERLQYYNSLKIKYSKALKLQSLASGYRDALEGMDTGQLLLQSLESGHIGIIDYVYGVEQWNDAVTEALGAEKDYRLLLSELRFFAE